MNRRDRSVVGVLVVALAVVAAIVALPSFQPASIGVGADVPTPSSSSGASAVPAVPTYREGIVGRWSSITPVTARSNADRELVALVFSGLVRLGAGGEVLPDLAASWTVDRTGAHYTFRLRPDATWQDGTPVTAADVDFTFRTLRDPGYTGPQATSWREVTVVVLDDHTVRFDLSTPLGGFLQTATQPLLPEHLLRGVAPADMAGSAFASQPVGSGPYRLVHLDSLVAELEPAAGGGSGSSAPESGPATSPAASAERSPGGAATPSGSVSSGDAATIPSGPVSSAVTGGPTPAPSSGPLAGSPGLASPGLARIRIEFFDDPAALSSAYRAGRLDAAVGLTPAPAAALAALPGSRLLAYPTATLTAVLMNQRGRSVFRNESLRGALTRLIDREALVSDILLGQGARADGLTPPGSWAFDAKATKEIAYDPAAAASLMAKAGWRKLSGGWAAPGRSTPIELSLIAPDRQTNALTFAAASRVAKAWRAFGLKIRLEGLAPGAFAKRLQAGSYSLAAVDMNLGLDPDLYPLLASTQTTTSGSNISGVQSLVLDDLLTAARRPGSMAARKKAYAALETFLARVSVVLPLYFRDEPVVLADALQGPAIREIGDPGDRFWDVLTWRLAGAR